MACTSDIHMDILHISGTYFLLFWLSGCLFVWIRLIYWCHLLPATTVPAQLPTSPVRIFTLNYRLHQCGFSCSSSDFIRLLTSYVLWTLCTVSELVPYGLILNWMTGVLRVNWLCLLQVLLLNCIALAALDLHLVHCVIYACANVCNANTGWDPHGYPRGHDVGWRHILAGGSCGMKGFPHFPPKFIL